MKFTFFSPSLWLCRDSNYAPGHSTELGGGIGIMSSARTGPRILHILGSAGRGGTEVNTYAFCFLGKISPIAEDLEHEGLKTYYLPWTIPMVVLALYRLFQVNYYYAFFKTLAGLAFAGKRDR